MMRSIHALILCLVFHAGLAFKYQAFKFDRRSISLNLFPPKKTSSVSTEASEITRLFRKRYSSFDIPDQKLVKGFNDLTLLVSHFVKLQFIV